MAQQCEHNLASSSWKIANSASNPRLWHGLDAEGVSTLSRPTPHSEILHPPLEVDCLQLVGSCCGGFCMRTNITVLRGTYFFLCVAFFFVADAVTCSSHLKHARVWNWMCCVLLGLLCENWAVCLCMTAAFKQFSFVLFENNRLFLLFGLCGNMMLLARKVCVPEQITRHSVIQKFRTIEKLYNIKTKIITWELYKN